MAGFAEKNTRTGNRILAKLPPKEQERLLPRFEIARLERGQVLYEPGEIIRYARKSKA
jgi:hypothetical protein